MNPNPSDHPERARGPFLDLEKAAARAAALLDLFELAPPEHQFEIAKFKAFGSQIAGEIRAALKATGAQS